METVQYIYLFALVVGLGYVLISGLLGHIGGDADLGGHDFDAGGHDFDAGGHDFDGPDADVGGDLDAGHAGLHFSPFSPLVIASFVGAFGAVGLIGSGIKLPTLINLPLAIAGGVGIGFLIAWLMAKLNQMSMAQTDIISTDLIGNDALVSVQVPATGYGEITYEARGVRFNAPAQSEGKVEIPKDSMVTITRIVGNTFFVKPSMSERLRNL